MLTIIGVFLFSNLTFAKSTSQATPDIEPILTNSTYTQKELKQIREIHGEAVKQGAVTLNEDGTITVNVDTDTIGVDEDVFGKYIQSVENINDIIKLGIASFDENFNLKVAPGEESINIISERDRKLQQSGTLSTNRFDTPSSISLPITSVLPTLNAYGTARNNKATLSDYFDAIQVYAPWSAYPSTVSFWISKVREGGAWDYKIVPGYAPYNKEWLAVTYDTTSVRTSEWFGNYNYGFTGRFLFSLNVLLAGGDGVNYVFNHTMDDPADRQAVTWGYNESGY